MTTESRRTGFAQRFCPTAQRPQGHPGATRTIVILPVSEFRLESLPTMGHRGAEIAMRDLDGLRAPDGCCPSRLGEADSGMTFGVSVFTPGWRNKGVSGPRRRVSCQSGALRDRSETKVSSLLRPGVSQVEAPRRDEGRVSTLPPWDPETRGIDGTRRADLERAAARSLRQAASRAGALSANIWRRLNSSAAANPVHAAMKIGSAPHPLPAKAVADSSLDRNRRRHHTVTLRS